MGHVYRQGRIQVELNGTKGVFCKACLKDCAEEHLITMRDLPGKLSNRDFYEHLCVTCAKDLVACLHKALGIALITEKDLI